MPNLTSFENHLSEAIKYLYSRLYSILKICPECKSEQIEEVNSEIIVITCDKCKKQYSHIIRRKYNCLACKNIFIDNGVKVNQCCPDCKRPVMYGTWSQESIRKGRVKN